MADLAESFISFLIRETFISAGICLLAYLFSTIFRKADNRWHFLLWSLIVCRLIFPVYLPQALGTYSIWNGLNSDAGGSVIHIPGSITGSEGTVTETDSGVREFNGTLRGEAALILSVIWLISIIMIGKLWLRRTGKYRQIVKQSSHYKEGEEIAKQWRKRLNIRRSIRVVSSDLWDTPFTIGVLKPSIFIPLSIKADSSILQAVIAHEAAHIKRLDALWNSIQNIVQILYFFNPALWIAVRMTGRFREMACDDMVVRSDGIQWQIYGEGLIKFVEKGVVREKFWVLQFAAKPVKLRLTNIRNENRNSKILLICLNVLTLTVFTALQPIGASEAVKSKTIETHQISGNKISFMWPVKPEITFRFGRRKNPFSGKYYSHRGVDLSGNTGTPVKAAAGGVVKKCFMASKKKRGDSRGNYITLEHSSGYITKYYHLQKVEVKKGQKVLKGEVIGRLGSTGKSTGPHLHFEIVKDGVEKNPETYLK